MSEAGLRLELERIRKVSDQLCSAHSSLRDRYATWALVVDLFLLLLTAWLTAMAFVDHTIARYLTPPPLDPGLWIGLLSVAAFCTSLVQLRTDWKGRSEAHKRTFELYAEVKREAGYLLASSPDQIATKEFQRVAARYDMASDAGIGVPEREFLKQKQRHRIKVELSKVLDSRPAAPIWLEKVKMLIRDVGAKRHGSGDATRSN